MRKTNLAYEKVAVTSIEDVPLNNFHQLMTLRAGGGWILDGYILSIIGVAIVQFSDYLKLDSFWQGMVAASAMLGTFFSGFLGGWLTDRLGRRRLFFVGPSCSSRGRSARCGSNREWRCSSCAFWSAWAWAWNTRSPARC